jgi:hypothetical protein
MMMDDASKPPLKFYNKLNPRRNKKESAPLFLKISSYCITKMEKEMEVRGYELFI